MVLEGWVLYWFISSLKLHNIGLSSKHFKCIHVFLHAYIFSIAYSWWVQYSAYAYVVDVPAIDDFRTWHLDVYQGMLAGIDDLNLIIEYKSNCIWILICILFIYLYTLEILRATAHAENPVRPRGRFRSLKTAGCCWGVAKLPQSIMDGDGLITIGHAGSHADSHSYWW